MSPALLTPMALAALGAIAIPLILHIARRTENRTIAFAALRWLDARPKPRQSLTLDERWLLAARLLLLTLLAMCLARPVLLNAADGQPVVGVVPGTSARIIASMTDDRDRIVWLAPGFPAVGGPVPRPATDVVSLIRQLDAELPPRTPVALIVPATLDGVDAERPRLSHRVDWRVGPDLPVAGPTKPRSPPDLIVRYDAEGEVAVRYFRAAATAWGSADARPGFEADTVDQSLPRQTNTLIWLATGPLPAGVLDWVKRGGIILTAVDTRAPVEGETTVVWRDETGVPLALSGSLGRGRVIRMTRALEPAMIPQLSDARFPDSLMAMLVPSAMPARVVASAHAPVLGGTAYDIPPLDLRPWLALLIAAVFAGERWLATRRQRGVAP